MFAYIILRYICDPIRGKAYTHDQAQLDRKSKGKGLQSWSAGLRGGAEWDKSREVMGQDDTGKKVWEGRKAGNKWKGRKGRDTLH